MFKQVFTKLFNTTSSSNNNRQKIQKYEHRPPIYNPIPTISSCFQQQETPLSPSLYDDNNNIQKSPVSSSISPKPTTSKNSLFSSNFKNSSTRQIFIAPHVIRYTNSTLDDTIYRIDDESLNEIATEILESDLAPPKLQIVLYEQKYFAINNSHLQIYKQMQYVGLITHVQADVLAIEAIPLPLRKHLLQTPLNLANSDESSSSSSDDNEDEDDEEEDYDQDETKKGNVSACSSTSSGIIDDIDTRLNALVDETYEFGTSENCVDSDLEDSDDDEDQNNDIDNVRKINKFITENMSPQQIETKDHLNKNILKLRLNELNYNDTECNEYQNFVALSSSNEKTSKINNEQNRRRQNLLVKSNDESKCELKSLLSDQ